MRSQKEDRSSSCLLGGKNLVGLGERITCMKTDVMMVPLTAEASLGLLQTEKRRDDSAPPTLFASKVLNPSKSFNSNIQAEQSVSDCLIVKLPSV